MEINTIKTDDGFFHHIQYSDFQELIKDVKEVAKNYGKKTMLFCCHGIPDEILEPLPIGIKNGIDKKVFHAKTFVVIEDIVRIWTRENLVMPTDLSGFFLARNAPKSVLLFKPINE